MAMRPHWHVVSPAVKGAYRGISAALAGTDFYLAGGTAVALRLGHRRSDDLDFFSCGFREVNELQARLVEVFPDLVVTYVAPRTLYGLANGVQVSFFGYGYPVLTPPDELSPGLLPVAGIPDLTAMKLAAIASRGSRKDFVDLWFLLQQGITLEQSLDWFKKKYPIADIGHVIRSFFYFDEADEEPSPCMVRPVSWAEIKAFLLREAERLLA
ncbi:MAG: nucleotidyl transferase AbiEii/AbiGii toxin family protein [Thermoanaerobaculum sp.]